MVNQDKSLDGFLGEFAAYTPPAPKHVPKLEGEILELRNKSYEAKVDLRQAKNDEARDEIFGKLEELDGKILKLENGIGGARKQDEDAAKEHKRVWVESMKAQAKGLDLGAEVFDAQERELIELENKVSLTGAMSAIHDKRGQTSEYMELMDGFGKGWGWDHRKGERLFGGEFDPVRAIPYALLLTTKERQEMYKKSAAASLAFAATTTGSYTPASDTPRVVRAKMILERIFAPTVMGFLGADQNAVDSGAVNLTIARATDPANSYPDVRDEEAVTPAYGLSFRTHTMQLKAIQGLLEYTNESALLNPGQTNIIRADIRNALLNSVDQTFLYGATPNHHEGMMYAANTEAITGLTNRESSDIMGTTSAIDYSGAFSVDKALEVLSTEITGGGGGLPVDDIHAMDYSDLRILFPTSVGTKVRKEKSSATDNNAWQILRNWGVGLRSTSRIPAAVAVAVTPGTPFNGNGFHAAKHTYGFGVRGNEPEGVGDVSTFPAMEIVIDRGNKASSRIIQVYATAYTSIYAALRPERCYRYLFEMLS